MQQVKVGKKKINKLFSLTKQQFWSLQEVEEQVFQIVPSLKHGKFEIAKQMSFSTDRYIVMRDGYRIYFDCKKDIQKTRNLLIGKKFESYKEVKEFLEKNGIKATFPLYYLQIVEEKDCLRIGILLKKEEKIERYYINKWKVYKGGTLSS